MSTKSLLEPILDQGIRNIHFFEGRLLTGRDLREQQDANRSRHRQLGRAIGAGVVEGLEVEEAEIVNDGSGEKSPGVKVYRGLAINGRGQALELPDEYVMVKLSRTFEEVEAVDSVFYQCVKLPASRKVPNGAGIYILVMSPAEGYTEYAPKSGIESNGIVRGCGRRYKVDGVRFRLVELDPTVIPGISDDTVKYFQDELACAGAYKKEDNPARVSKFRNMIAHLCFGTEKLSEFAADPFKQKNGESYYLKYGALDHLLDKEGGLTLCDVPLALLYWTLDGITFLDMWSVRRRPYEIAPSAQWPTLISPRRQAEAEAMFFQFQNHISELITEYLTLTETALMEAIDYFHYLPPVGFLPLLEDNYRGVNIDAFFQRQPHRDQEFVGGEIIKRLVHQSVSDQPFSTSEREMVWIYRVWQHAKAIKDGNEMQPYIIFTGGHAPYMAEAHFDLARWDYSNYTRL